MKYCNSYLKRLKCVKICERMERYANQDYASLREVVIERHFLDMLYERALQATSAPVAEKYKEFLEIIRPRIGLLTKKQKKVLYLFYYKDMTISDISRKLRTTRPAASIRLKNALTKLKSGENVKRRLKAKWPTSTKVEVVHHF